MRAAYDPAPRRPLSSGERLGAALFALSLLGLLVAELLDGFVPAKLSVVFILLFWVPLLLVHELGHALCARLVGFRVDEMVLGFGPELGRFSVLGTRVVVRLVPIEGYVVPVPNGVAAARGKNAFVYFGGPAAELSVAVLLWLAFGSETMFQRGADLGVIAAQSAALAALFGAAVNLIPRVSGGSPSDGLGILLSATLSDAHFRYRMALPVIREAQRRIDADEPERALGAVDAALAREPDNLLWLATRSHCLAAAGRVEEAMAELERLRELPPAGDLVEAERLHAAACVVLEAQDESLYREAEQACRAALERVPGAEDIEVTLGAILLLEGRADEAERALQQAFKRTRNPLFEDRCLAYLALASAQLGRERDASLYRNALAARRPGRRLRRLALPSAL